jgi:UDP-N-acetylglucosamine 2-epimerase (non-hydrolysing)
LIESISRDVLDHHEFDYVVIQGDTTTVLAGSLAAFYKKIKIVHIEAGLRSHDIYSPFPEEMNRKMVSQIAFHHFCPTSSAVNNLIREGFTKNIHLSGNSVIDALLSGVESVRTMDQNSFAKKFDGIDLTKKIILVTCHRRENFGAPLARILDSIMNIASEHSDSIQVLYTVHLNPNVKIQVENTLKAKNIILVPPLNYPELLWIMDKCYFIITDSGGIQEEAPSLKKPVLIMRENTERFESIEGGNAILVGSDKEKITGVARRLILEKDFYDKMSQAENPYGNGKTSEFILDVIKSDT